MQPVLGSVKQTRVIVAKSCGARRGPHRIGQCGFTPVRLSRYGSHCDKRCLTARKTAYSAASLEKIETFQITKESEKFDWLRQWYPLAVVDDLDPHLPHPLQLLGKDLVAWQDKEGQWNVFEDKCPHRLAPLSEGRINPEDGTLQCSYHGWRFNATGSCVAIPQAASSEAEAVAAASSRACAAVHPSKVAIGLLWVWGDSSTTAQIDAAAKQLPLPEVMSEGGGPVQLADQRPFMRELPMDYAILVENLLDPAHLPFAHHGITRDRNKVKYGEYDLKLRRSTEPHTIESVGDGERKFTAPSKFQFIKFLNESRDKSHQLVTYVVPTKPGYTRLVQFTIVQLPWLRRTLMNMQWYNHTFFLNQVLDGDNYFLHVIQQVTAAEYIQNGRGWQKLYYMPTSSDALITAFRQWMDKKGGGGPWGCNNFDKFPAATMSRKDALDRYNQHTKHCKSCKKALENIRLLSGLASGVVMVCCAAGLMAALSQGIGALAAPQWLACGVGAALAAAAQHLLQKLEKQLVFTDYVHGLK